jgi:hypothetical protein
MDKHKPTQKIQQIEQRAQIEFAAPHSLAECLFRLRDTKHLEPGYLSPGIDPSFQKIDSITYSFRIRRTWYDYRYRRHHSSVEARGFLRAIDNGTTMVIGKIRFSRSIIAVIVVLVCLLAVTFAIPARDGSNIFLFALFVTVVGVFVGTLYFDRRTLIKLLQTTLDGDV